jgi:ABC-type multidrug transport system ATPase subunit
MVVTAGDAALRVNHTAIRRGSRVVLEQGGFDLPVQGTIGLIGANGAGKSTLLLAMADLLTARSGALSVSVAGAPPSISILLQAGGLPRWATAGTAAAALYGANLDRLAAQLPGLRLQGLADRRIDNLSGGDLQTLAFALVMNCCSAVTLLDEPLAHMDLGRRRAALDLIHGRRQGVVLMSAQSAADVAGCDGYLVIRDRRYVFRGSRDELLADAPGHGATEVRVERRLIRLLGLDATVAPERTARSFSD